LVQRQPDPGDGRASLVSLTGDGKEAIEAYRQRAISSLAGGIDSFSAEERRILAQAVPLLQRLNDQVAAKLDH
ncbi:MAG: MarR family transcriptional regulator, partial [Glutamicibacter sp.]